MKKRTREEMKNELMEIVQSATPEQLKKITFLLEWKSTATKAEMAALKKQSKRKDFSISAWIEKQKSLQSSGSATFEMGVV